MKPDGDVGILKQPNGYKGIYYLFPLHVCLYIFAYTIYVNYSKTEIKKDFPTYPFWPLQNEMFLLFPLILPHPLHGGLST
jgi:hypothetical protein